MNDCGGVGGGGVYEKQLKGLSERPNGGGEISGGANGGGRIFFQESNAFLYVENGE